MFAYQVKKLRLNTFLLPVGNAYIFGIALGAPAGRVHMDGRMGQSKALSFGSCAKECRRHACRHAYGRYRCLY